MIDLNLLIVNQSILLSPNATEWNTRKDDILPPSQLASTPFPIMPTRPSVSPLKNNDISQSSASTTPVRSSPSRSSSSGNKSVGGPYLPSPIHPRTIISQSQVSLSLLIMMMITSNNIVNIYLLSLYRFISLFLDSYLQLLLGSFL